MAKVPLESSFLQAAEYDDTTQRLRLELTSGKVYDYADVPPDVYVALLAAESAGQFYGAHIRTRYQAPEPEEDSQEAVPWERRLLAEAWRRDGWLPQV